MSYSNMNLDNYHRKKGKADKSSPVLPVLKSGQRKYHGKFNGFSVIIENETEMKNVFCKGCFGKGNLSKSKPCFNENSVKILRQRQFDAYSEISKQFNLKPESINKVLVVPDSDSESDDYFDDLKPTYQIEQCLLNEELHLCPEEAFFLHHDVKCLNISYNCNELNTENIWGLFCQTDRYFVQNYIVYYHFRAKNWVVKPGFKFGCDYLLYQEGPAYCHASYMVFVDVLDQSTREKRQDLCRRDIKVNHLKGLTRLSQTTGKEILICQILWPSALSDLTAADIGKFQINELVVRRWTPSQELTNKSSECCKF